MKTIKTTGISVLHRSPKLALAAVSLAVLALATPAWADIQGFGATGWTTNGAASISTNALQVTDGASYEAGSAFYGTPQNITAFTASFTYQSYHQGGGAIGDGMVFVLQNQGPTALGSALGYWGPSGSPTITNATGIAFNLYQTTGRVMGIGYAPTAVPDNGYQSVSPVNLLDPVNVTVTYDGTNLTVTLADVTTGAHSTNTYQVNLAAAVGSTTAYVGFSGSCGAAAQQQFVSNFQFQSQAGSPPPPPPTEVTGFGGNGSGWTTNGASSISSNVLQVTTGVGDEAGSAFYDTPQTITAFTASFTYKSDHLGGGATGDGMVFVLQNQGPTALGSALGYWGPTTATTITNATGIAFNLYQTTGRLMGIGYAPTAVPTNGYTSVSPVNLLDPVNVTVTYDGTNLTVVLADVTSGSLFTNTYQVNLAAAVGSNTAYVGFSGSCGAAAQQQFISNFQFQSQPVSPPPPPTTEITGFGSNGTGWITNGASSISSNVLQVTDGASWEAGSAFYDTPQTITAFKASFLYQSDHLGGGEIGDGMAFVIQNEGPTALGSGLGFWGTATNATPDASGIAFNLYETTGRVRGIGYAPTAVPTDTYQSVSPVNLLDPVSITVVYDGAAFTVTLDDLATGAQFTNAYAANLTAAVGGNTAYIGFSGNCGAAAQQQFISNFTFETLPNQPASIDSQPASQTAVVGAQAAFTVVAGGAPPLSYQWFFNSNRLAGATGSSLTLTNVQLTNAGAYSVAVSNSLGVVVSSNAVLTVTAAVACVVPPAGLVGWWRAEGDATDYTGQSNGKLQGAVTFAHGEVGQSFVLNNPSAQPAGTADVDIPATPVLNVGTGPGLTAEAWINPWDVEDQHPVVEWNDGYFGVDLWLSVIPLGGGAGAGCLCSNIKDTDLTDHPISSQSGLVATGVWQHVALTFDKASGIACLYLNGSNVAQANLGTLSPKTTGDFCLGFRPYDNGAGYRFAGQLDEVSVYARALSAGEIQAIFAAGSSGKCVEAIAPFVLTQPQNQTAQAGATVSFSATAGGSLPLSYQWFFNSNRIAGATGSSLTLTNVQLTNAGAYSVAVSNSLGYALSSNAVLTVQLPPALVAAANVNAVGSRAVTVPIFLVANGNENAVAFTLDFNPALLTFSGVVLGSGDTGAALVSNAGQATNGLLGVGLALPYGTVFAAGTQQIANVMFTTPFTTNGATTTIGFGSQVTKSEVVDADANSLPATFASGLVTIAPTPIAGDVWPRPNGDEQVTLNDWVLEGRYVAGLDYPTNASEFARADCAPRATGGDGAITIQDWVQVGRYMVGLDPVTPAGTNTGSLFGPAVVSRQRQMLAPSAKIDSSRQLQVQGTALFPGQSGTVLVNLNAAGNENALGFSVSFNPAQLTYTGASAGSTLAGAEGAAFIVNDQQAASGRLGFILALPPGSTLPSGSLQLARITFAAARSASGSCPVAIAGNPVTAEVSDAFASSLGVSGVNGAVTVSSLPALSATPAGRTVQLSWPAGPGNFVLEEASGNVSSGLSWSATGLTPAVTPNANVVTVPLGPTNKFYRLRLQ